MLAVVMIARRMTVVRMMSVKMPVHNDHLYVLEFELRYLRSLTSDSGIPMYVKMGKMNIPAKLRPK